MRLAKYQQRRLVVAALFFCAFAFAVIPAQCADQQKELHWSELSPAILGRQIQLVAKAGPIAGNVTAVDAEDLRILPKHAKRGGGEVAVARSEVSIIELQATRGKGRVIGGIAGGACGFVIGLGAAIADTVATNSGSGNGGRDSAVVIAATAGGATAGYFIGRRFDRHSTIIKVLPD